MAVEPPHTWNVNLMQVLTQPLHTANVWDGERICLADIARLTSKKLV